MGRKWQLETEGGREGHISSRKPESQLVLGQFRILIRLNSFGYFYVENELIPFEKLRFTIFEICGIDPTLIMYNGGDERWRLSETTRRSITVRKRICGEGTNIDVHRIGDHMCSRWPSSVWAATVAVAIPFLSRAVHTHA